MMDDALRCDDERDGTFARDDGVDPRLASRGASAPDRDAEDALCEAALARFAEALRRVVQD